MYLVLEWCSSLSHHHFALLVVSGQVKQGEGSSGSQIAKKGGVGGVENLAYFEYKRILFNMDTIFPINIRGSCYSGGGGGSIAQTGSSRGRGLRVTNCKKEASRGWRIWHILSIKEHFLTWIV